MRLHYQETGLSMNVLYCSVPVLALKLVSKKFTTERGGIISNIAGKGISALVIARVPYAVIYYNFEFISCSRSVCFLDHVFVFNIYKIHK